MRTTKTFFVTWMNGSNDLDKPFTYHLVKLRRGFHVPFLGYKRSTIIPARIKEVSNTCIILYIVECHFYYMHKFRCVNATSRKAIFALVEASIHGYVGLLANAILSLVNHDGSREHRNTKTHTCTHK